MIEWLRKNFPLGHNYLIAQKNTEQINSFLYQRLVLSGQFGRKHNLWGETARQLSKIGSKIGWVPNKMPAVFLADSVELELADACAAADNLLQPQPQHFDNARKMLAQINLLYLAQQNPFFLSEGETKLLWFLTQRAKQPEYLIIGHLPTNLSKIRTDELINFILQAEKKISCSQSILLGYDSHQTEWFSPLLKNNNWKLISQCPDYDNID